MTTLGLLEFANNRYQEILNEDFRSIEPILRTEIVQVDPALAAEWLQGHINYRSLSKERVTLYARDMTAGKWELNGAAIQFDRNGLLVDGQHRLTAILKSKCTVPMLIVWGVDSANNIDTGRKRSLRDLVRNMGFKAYSIGSVIVSRAPSIVELMGNSGSLKNRGEQTISEQVEFAKRNRLLIEQASLFGLKLDRCFSGVRVSTILFIAMNIDIEKAQAFGHAIKQHGYTSPDHPCNALRRALVNAKVRRSKVSDVWEYAILIKAYNAFATDQRIKNLKFSLDEKFPEMVGIEKARKRLGL